MIYRHILTSLFLLTLISLSSNAFPPSSPAGGNYLALDGVDDYAVLDFKTFDVLLPKGTDEFTVEAWVYPTTPPDKNTTAMILSQQVLMRVVSYENEGYKTAEILGGFYCVSNRYPSASRLCPILCYSVQGMPYLVQDFWTFR